MNQDIITYKPQAPEFRRKTFVHTQICREGDFAIYHKYAEKTATRHKEFDAGFEVVVIRRHNGYVIGGVQIEPAEVYPCDSQWGDFGWTYSDLLGAMRRFEKLVKGEIKVVDDKVVELDSPAKDEPEQEPVDENGAEPAQGRRGRKRKERPNLNIPDGEFTMQLVAELNGMDKLNIYVYIRELVEQGVIEEVRRESHGRGRPTVIFQKVQVPA